jgi:pyrroline-5-carboxylate reductase
MKSIAIIGTGNVGRALARVFARQGVEALLANTRGPESFDDLAEQVAPHVRATTLEEARQADIVILAMPFQQTRVVRGLEISMGRSNHRGRNQRIPGPHQRGNPPRQAVNTRRGRGISGR